MMKIEPLGNQVLIKRIDKEEVTSGSIIIPDVAQEKPTESIVIAIGDDKGIKVKPGDRVLVGRFCGMEVEIDKQTLIIINYEDIAAKIIAEEEKDGSKPAKRSKKS